MRYCVNFLRTNASNVELLYRYFPSRRNKRILVKFNKLHDKEVTETINKRQISGAFIFTASIHGFEMHVFQLSNKPS
jgi:hypothetical protein